MNIEIHPKTVFRTLLYLILALLVANILGIISKFYFDEESAYGLIPFFDFDTEKNVPTLYQSFALLVVSVLSGVVASIQRKTSSSWVPWLGLAIIFLFLSVDEFNSIHERLAGPIRRSLDTSGLLFFAWIIPYGIGLGVFLMAYYRFLINLPKKIRLLFIVSGSIFVGAAIGFEMLAGRHTDLYGFENLTNAFYYTCEEFGEMLGIVIFIYALLTYMAGQFKPLTFSIREALTLEH